jgi:hypothetical protein
MLMGLCYRDVRLKSQLKQIAEGARHIMPSSQPSSSPYGADWDVLWLGQYVYIPVLDALYNSHLPWS